MLTCISTPCKEVTPEHTMHYLHNVMIYKHVCQLEKKVSCINPKRRQPIFIMLEYCRNCTLNVTSIHFIYYTFHRRSDAIAIIYVLHNHHLVVEKTKPCVINC